VSAGSAVIVMPVAGRGLQPRPKRLTDEDMAVIIENGRDGGATPVPLRSTKDTNNNGELLINIFVLFVLFVDKSPFVLGLTDNLKSLFKEDNYESKYRLNRPGRHGTKPGA